MLAVDRVGGANDRARPQFCDAAAHLLDRRRHIVHCDLRGEFEALRVGFAVIGGPIVVGARECRRIIGRQIVMT